jgi:NAD(P)-dependent dehydrogenase (short-subunit alcohol dehydrogenase family)
MHTGAKAAIVTGAASGLGRAMAMGLVGSGMNVVAVDREPKGLAVPSAPERSASGSGTLCHGDGAQRRGRRRRVFMFAPARLREQPLRVPVGDLLGDVARELIQVGPHFAHRARQRLPP